MGQALWVVVLAAVLCVFFASAPARSESATVFDAAAEASVVAEVEDALNGDADESEDADEGEDEADEEMEDTEFMELASSFGPFQAAANVMPYNMAVDPGHNFMNPFLRGFNPAYDGFTPQPGGARWNNPNGPNWSPFHWSAPPSYWSVYPPQYASHYVNAPPMRAPGPSQFFGPNYNGLHAGHVHASPFNNMDPHVYGPHLDWPFGALTSDMDHVPGMGAGTNAMQRFPQFLEVDDDTEESEEDADEESEETEDESDESEADAFVESASDAETEAEADASKPKIRAVSGKKLLKHTIEAEYFRPNGAHRHHKKNHKKSFVAVEYGDPHPAATARKARRAAKLAASGAAPAPQKVFKTSFLSPLPESHPFVRCYGKGEHEKCYRVDKQTGTVLGRPEPHNPFKFVVSGARTVESYAGHAMEKHGFQEPSYDDKLAAWKPRKHKRTLSPTPVKSL